MLNILMRYIFSNSSTWPETMMDLPFLQPLAADLGRVEEQHLKFPKLFCSLLRGELGAGEGRHANGLTEGTE
jgi:hypothetical protein